MKNNISPEEKLLKLIRGQNKPNISNINTERNPARIPLDLKTSAKYSTSLLFKIFSFRYIKKIIFAAFILSCIYFIACLIYPFTGLKKITLPILKPEKTNEFKLKPMDEIRPLESYLSDVKSRRIFASLSSPQETEKPAVVINTDFIKDLNLVGIISGEPPQAIIEDKKTQKTYTLTAGQSFGEFRLESIEEGKVLVTYQEQKFELYL
ncbi:MAG: hypothetical protein V2A64_04405 [Candidatus Omnitrophota bacterium]